MIIRELKEVDLFSGLTEEELDHDVHGEIIELRAADVLFYEGDEAKYFYIVLGGRLKCTEA